MDKANLWVKSFLSTFFNPIKINLSIFELELRSIFNVSYNEVNYL